MRYIFLSLLIGYLLFFMRIDPLEASDPYRARNYKQDSSRI